jgi:hypothetical protein
MITSGAQNLLLPPGSAYIIKLNSLGVLKIRAKTSSDWRFDQLEGDLLIKSPCANRWIRVQKLHISRYTDLLREWLEQRDYARLRHARPGSRQNYLADASHIHSLRGVETDERGACSHAAPLCLPSQSQRLPKNPRKSGLNIPKNSPQD